MFPPRREPVIEVRPAITSTIAAPDMVTAAAGSSLPRVAREDAESSAAKEAEARAKGVALVQVLDARRARADSEARLRKAAEVLAKAETIAAADRQR